MNKKLIGPTMMFVGFSAADVFLTNTMIKSGIAIEANPVAAVFHENLYLYKLFMVTFVLMVVMLIARLSVKTAFWTMMFGTGATALVVLYSAALLVIAQSIGI